MRTSMALSVGSTSGMVTGFSCRALARNAGSCKGMTGSLPGRNDGARNDGAPHRLCPPSTELRVTAFVVHANHCYLDAVIELIDRELLADDGSPCVRVRIDRWMVELIATTVETKRPSMIRAFVR